MKTHPVKVWFAASLAAVVGLASTPAWADSVTEPVTQAVHSICSGEDIDITGTLTADTEVNTEAQGGVHISTLVRIRATGVGRDSGAQYSVNNVTATNLEMTGEGP